MEIPILSSYHIPNEGDYGTIANYFENDRWYSSSGGGDSNESMKFYDASFVAVGTNCVEWKVPLSHMGDLNGKYVMFMTNSRVEGIPSDDINDLTIQLISPETEFECNSTPTTYYRDLDSDGFGDSNNSIEAFLRPYGYVFNINDCNDNDSTVYPGATEIRGDGIDQDCDGSDSETQSTQEIVTEIYVATFGRAPANSGLNYWTDAVDSGSFTIDQVAQSFFDQPETKKKFPEGSSNSEFITTIFYNVLNRTPAASGLAYWTDALNTGALRRDQAIMAVINGAKSATGSSEDATILAQKTEIGVYFANSQIGISFSGDEEFMYWAEDVISFSTIDEVDEYIEEIMSFNTYSLDGTSFSVKEVRNLQDCGVANDINEFTAYIYQYGSNLEVYDATNGMWSYGTLSGNTATLTASWYEYDGWVDAVYTIMFNDDKKSFSGTSSGTWTDGYSSCNPTTTVSATQN